MSDDPASLGVMLDEIADGLAGVQEALDRLDAGTYGSCEVCGEAIDDATLEASPTVTVCGAHRAGQPG